MTDLKWWIGMVGSVLVSVAGITSALPEPWRPYIAVGGAIGAGISGYMIRRPDSME